MKVVRSSAGVGDTNVETLYYLAIAAARETLDLTAAYFAPRPAFVEALEDARERGVRVAGPRAGREHRQAARCGIAGRASYDELVDRGVRGLRVRPDDAAREDDGVDGRWSAVGSANFDNRSFQLNDEATLCVASSGVRGEAHGPVRGDLEVSERIDAERWSTAGAAQRAQEATLKVARREL